MVSKKSKNWRFAEAALALRTSELSASTPPEGPLFQSTTGSNGSRRALRPTLGVRGELTARSWPARARVLSDPNGFDEIFGHNGVKTASVLERGATDRLERLAPRVVHRARANAVRALVLACGSPQPGEGHGIL